MKLKNTLGNVNQTRNIKKQIVKENRFDLNLANSIQKLALHFKNTDTTTNLSWDNKGWIFLFDSIDFSLGFWNQTS